MFLLNGIWMGRWTDNYMKLRVYLIRQPLNINGAFSVFGGSIASAADPFLPLMYKLATMQRGINISVWTKSVSVKFIKPINNLAYFDYVITEDELQTAIDTMKEKGKHVQIHHINCVNRHNIVYAIAEVHTYMKLHA